MRSIKNAIENALQVDLDGDGKIGERPAYAYGQGAQQQQQQQQQHRPQNMYPAQPQMQPAPQYRPQAPPRQGPQLHVTIPMGMQPGQTFQVRTPDGRLFSVQVPPGIRGGQTITIYVPPADGGGGSSFNPQPHEPHAQPQPHPHGHFPEPSAPDLGSFGNSTPHVGSSLPPFRPWSQFQGWRYQPVPLGPRRAPVCNPNAFVQPTGRRKALLIGINYTNTRAALRGCINDVHKMKRFLLARGFTDTPSNMLVLTDNSPHSHQPTYNNMLRAFQWLVDGASPGDVLFLHFSGHGAQQPDYTGQEQDGLNETILPIDFQQAGQITDDMIWDTLVFPLPSGCRLTALLDCCHCGTGMDLPFIWDPYRGWREENNPAHAMGDVQLFSGCEDGQTSVDAYDRFGAGGAMTSAFIDTVESSPFIRYPDLMAGVHQNLRARGFTQRPQLSTSQQFNPNERVFDLTDGFVPNGNPVIGKIQRTHFHPQNPNFQGTVLEDLLGAGAVAVAAGFAAGMVLDAFF